MPEARQFLAVRRFRLVTLVLPAVVTVVAVAVQLLALPHLPDPVAVHWGASGTPTASHRSGSLPC